MKTKIPRILGVVLTLVLLASLFGFAVPVSADPGNTQWAAQNLPSAAGYVMHQNSDITNIAVANDGVTVYVVNANSSAGEAFVSTDAGQSFTILAAPAAVALTGVAVAPDNVDAIACTDGSLVYVSNNGGVTWATLAALTGSWAGSSIQDIAVGPVRIGTLLAREYAIAVADPIASMTNTTGSRGDVLIIGEIATWASVGGTTGITGLLDYMAVTFTPNFIGDRSVVAVGGSINATAPGTGVFVHIINTATTSEVMAPILLHANGTDYSTTAVNTTDLVAADVALPSNFDPTTVAGRQTYAAVASFSGFAFDDVFRVSNTSVRALGTAKRPYTSIAYSGTVDTGTLFAGQYNSNTVYSTTNPQVSLPTWVTTSKSPGIATCTSTIVRVASDFATTSRVFGGVTGAQSAFSVSNNGGTSFDGTALVDNREANTVVTIDDLALTPDGGTIYVATNSSSRINLWKSATPVNPYSWSRIFVANATTTGTAAIRLNPDWATSPSLYLVERSLGGSIWYAADGGDIFSVRAAPSTVTPADLAVESATTVYLGATGTAGTIYKSTASAWSWTPGVVSRAGTITSLACPQADHLLVGGTGAVTYSLDGAATFTLIPTGLTGSAAYRVIADGDYANNNTIFAGGNNAAAGNILRFIIGTDTAWATLTNPTPQAVVGMAHVDGALYGMMAANGSQYTCDRNLFSYKEPGLVAGYWDTMDVALTVEASSGLFAVASGNNLYAANASTAALWAYSDWLANTAPVVTAPPDGYAVTIDPVSGRAESVWAEWAVMGTGTGMVDTVAFLVWETLKGSGSAVGLSTAVLGTAPRADLAALMSTAGVSLRANTAYEWIVKASDEASNDAVRSLWSDVYSFSVEAGGIVQSTQVGPILLGPAGGATNVLLTPGFSWTPLSGATEYEFILATDAALTNTIAGTPATVTIPSSQATAALEYSTTYFWAVRVTAPTESPQSVGTFTTMAEPAAQVVVEPAAEIVPGYIYAIIGVGAVLVIVVLVLIVRTRRPM